MMLTGALSATEMITQHYFNPLNLNLTGLGQVAKDNYGEFESIVDELMIKHATGMYLSPEVRLMLAIGATVATVHTANNGDPKLAETLKNMHRKATPPPGSKDL